MGTRRRPAPPLLPRLLITAWLLGGAVGAVRIAVEGAAATRWRRAGTPVRDPWLAARLLELAWRLGLRPGDATLPDFRQVPGSGSPALTGCWRPAILLPEELLRSCDAGELQLILGHELAHFQRRDLLWGWVPAVAHLLFFFHPLVWLANGEYRAAQEMACDELAVRINACAPASYGQLLVKVARASQAWPQLALAPFSTDGSLPALKQRLAAVRRAPQPSGPAAALIPTLLVLAGLVGIIPWRLVAPTVSPPGGRMALEPVSIAPQLLRPIPPAPRLAPVGPAPGGAASLAQVPPVALYVPLPRARSSPASLLPPGGEVLAPRPIDATPPPLVHRGVPLASAPPGPGPGWQRPLSPSPAPPGTAGSWDPPAGGGSPPPHPGGLDPQADIELPAHDHGAAGEPRRPRGWGLWAGRNFGPPGGGGFGGGFVGGFASFGGGGGGGFLIGGQAGGLGGVGFAGGFAWGGFGGSGGGFPESGSRGFSAGPGGRGVGPIYRLPFGMGGLGRPR